MSKVSSNVGNGGAFNSLIVTAGGQVVATNTAVNFAVGNWAGGYANTLTVTGSGSEFKHNALKVGTAGSSNVMTVANGGLVVGVTGYVGASAGAGSNLVLVADAGSAWILSGALYVSVANTTNNTLSIANSGLVEANAFSLSGENNLITNSNGVLQFIAEAPSITINAGNAVVMDGGAMSYRSVTTVLDLLHRNATATYEGKFTWQGANRFRLNNATISHTAGYTFEATADPKNYAGLEMVDGTTAIAANPLTIGATGGSGLFSNTIATVSGVFTNNGTMTIDNATLITENECVLNGTLKINVDYLNGTDCAMINNNLTLGADSVIAFTGTTVLDVLPVLRYTGNLEGTFQTATGVPSGYSLRYGDGVIELLKLRGTLIRVQ